LSQPVLETHEAATKYDTLIWLGFFFFSLLKAKKTGTLVYQQNLTGNVHQTR